VPVAYICGRDGELPDASEDGRLSDGSPAAASVAKARAGPPAKYARLLVADIAQAGLLGGLFGDRVGVSEGLWPATSSMAELRPATAGSDYN